MVPRQSKAGRRKDAGGEDRGCKTPGGHVRGLELLTFVILRVARFLDGLVRPGTV